MYKKDYQVLGTYLLCSCGNR